MSQKIEKHGSNIFDQYFIIVIIVIFFWILVYFVMCLRSTISPINFLVSAQYFLIKFVCWSINTTKVNSFELIRTRLENNQAQKLPDQPKTIWFKINPTLLFSLQNQSNPSVDLLIYTKSSQVHRAHAHQPQHPTPSSNPSMHTGHNQTIVVLDQRLCIIGDIDWKRNNLEVLHFLSDLIDV